MTVASPLRALRRERRLTQQQLAELSGVDQTTISSLELGAAKSPSWETVGSLAQALGVEPHELFPLPARQEVA
jgi:transcriptional regulator with XRE-family HTH domain